MTNLRVVPDPEEDPGAELEVRSDDELVPVDPPEQPKTIFATVLAAKTAQRRPIVPAYLRSRQDLRDVARWASGHVLHLSAYHVTRTPKYAARSALRAPLGAGKLVASTARWVFDAEAHALRADAVHRKSSEDYLRLVKERNQRVHKRGITAAALFVLVAVTGVLVATVAPAWAQWLAAVFVVGLLGRLGSSIDKPLVDTGVVNIPRATRLTSEHVTRALGALGLAGINQALAKGPGITFPAPITRDGPGWRADVDLPLGVTAGDIIERRDKLASGLRRPLGCVWPEGAVEVHEGRLVLWVGDVDLNRAKQDPWPLLKAGQVSLFGSFPFGTDVRGRAVSVCLMFTNVLIGAIPRYGKTFALRLLLLAAALDPLAELRVYELKGTGDLSPLEPVCHEYASGADDGTLDATLASLRTVYVELERRAKVIRELPRDLCPENKVTPTLAARRSLGLHPLILAIDEAQELYSAGREAKMVDREASRLSEAIIKRGPALGVILLLATQRPDSNSLPTGVKANVGTRFCLRVMDQDANDMVLGTSAYKQGRRATMFGPSDRGIGFLVGAADDAKVTKTFYVDGPDAEKVVTRARVAREAAGTLSGHAVGAEPERGPSFSLLDDVGTVFATVQVAKMWSEQIIELLTELRPEVYGGWTPEALAQALKPLGLDTGQIAMTVDGERSNRRGVRRKHLEAALAGRAQRRAIDP